MTYVEWLDMRCKQLSILNYEFMDVRTKEKCICQRLFTIDGNNF